MKHKLIVLASILLIVSACKNDTKNDQSETAEPVAEPYKLQQTIYYNGDIITMEGDEPQYVEAVVQREGKIIFTGSKAEAFEQFEGKAKKHDLGGETMMPGFIEPHAHPVSIGAFILGNDIVAPHEWRMPHKTYPAAVGKEDYLAAVKKVVEEKKDLEYVLIWGYHQAWHGTLTASDLNSVTGDTPTLIFHRSGHEFYLNDAAMEKYGVDTDKFENQDQIDPENNHFWERGFQELRAGAIAPVYADNERLSIGMERISQMMLQNGLTAMAEPSFPNTEFHAEYDLLKAESDRSPFYSVYLIPGFPEQYTLKMGNEDFHEYIKNMKQYDTDNIEFLTDQYKTFSDGAIYSLALQLEEGFANCPHCHAEWIMPPDIHKTVFDYYWDNNFKIHIHVTGDKGLQAAIDILDEAMKRNPREDHQTTMHHLGLFDENQAQQMKDLGAEASVNPYYLWALANKYGEIGFGEERAERMTAMKWLIDRDIPSSVHSDFAMAPAEPLTLAWAAATRMSDDGTVKRPDLVIPVYDAMKAVTIDAARTISKENNIGSIKEGKQATFTILKENPFKVDPMHIKDIKVQGIVYKGQFKINKANNLRR